MAQFTFDFSIYYMQHQSLDMRHFVMSIGLDKQIF